MTARLLLIFTVLSVPLTCSAQQSRFTRADRLRGAITPEREWWDLQHYELSISVDPEARTLQGSNVVEFKVLKPAARMQIDLQKPLEIKNVAHGGDQLKFTRDGNVYWIDFPAALEVGSTQKVRIEYGGTPQESKRPPWSGGVTWTKDEKGHDFIATTCQGIGASIWWPTKDHQYDEPDRGVRINITVPENLTAVSNGRLTTTVHDHEAKTKTFRWRVVNPINNYAINMNIGNYVRFNDEFEGEKGKLDIEYWVLAHQKQTAERHFREAPRTLEAFEHWFGPYPFYEDSYKLVVVPYLGMEHQSSVTYGNGFRNGYRGRDLSKTGVGLKFDFIIVHESGHEWFGNNITSVDIADMWIHESFTNYSENLFVNYHFTKKEAEDYVIGCRDLVGNKASVIGKYGVNHSGDAGSDMYYKGGNMLHTIRNIIDDDEKWRMILRGLNQQFRHKTVTRKQIEDYVSDTAGIDIRCMFQQYLTKAELPVVRYKLDGSRLSYRFEDVVDGFSVRVRLHVDDKPRWVTPTTKWQSVDLGAEPAKVRLDRNWYMNFEPVE